MAAIHNQINGVPVLPPIQQLRERIPHLEIPQRNEYSTRIWRDQAPSASHRTCKHLKILHLARNGQGQMPSISHYNGNAWNANYGPKGNHHGNEISRNVVFNSRNYLYQGSRQHHDLQDNLNSFKQDLLDRLNKCRAEQAQNTNQDPRRSTIAQNYMDFVKENITYPELIMEIHCHTQIKENFDLEANKLNQDTCLGDKRRIDSQAGPSRKKSRDSKNKKTGVGNSGSLNMNQAPQNNQIPRFCKHTPTIASAVSIYYENEHHEIFAILPNIRTPTSKHDNSKYCHYHRALAIQRRNFELLKTKWKDSFDKDNWGIMLGASDDQLESFNTCKETSTYFQ